MSRRRISAACLLIAGATQAATNSPPSSWTASDDMLMFFDAATKIERHAVEPVDVHQVVEQALHAVVAGQDAYSRWMPPATYRRFKASRDPEYGGVGMELATDGTGRWVCLPYPDSPAARAGIRDGDVLVGVDGTDLVSTNLSDIGFLVRGQVGSAVSLAVLPREGPPRELEVTRERILAPSVVTEVRDEFRWVRIFTFNASTTEELQDVLGRVEPKEERLVIDLRGNPGGSLFDAIDAAKLFLPEGAGVATVRERTRERVYRSERASVCPAVPIVVLQDGRTASAAELFSAALVENDRATSVGVRTHGKGVTQRLVELTGGSAMILTDGFILTPGGLRFNQRGLEPDVAVDWQMLDERDVADRLREALDEAAIPRHP